MSLYREGTIRIPARSKIILSMNSYCLNLYKYEPFKSNIFEPKAIEDAGIPLLQELIQFSEKHPEKYREIQEIIWNIKNATPLEKYPQKLKRILFQVNPGYEDLLSKSIFLEKSKQLAFHVLSDFSGFFKEHFQKGFIGFDAAQKVIRTSTQGKEPFVSKDSSSFFEMASDLYVRLTPLNMQQVTLQVVNSSQEEKEFIPSNYYFSSEDSNVQDLGIFSPSSAFDE